MLSLEDLSNAIFYLPWFHKSYWFTGISSYFRDKVGLEFQSLAPLPSLNDSMINLCSGSTSNDTVCKENSITYTDVIVVPLVPSICLTDINPILSISNMEPDCKGEQFLGDTRGNIALQLMLTKASDLTITSTTFRSSVQIASPGPILSLNPEAPTLLPTKSALGFQDAQPTPTAALNLKLDLNQHDRKSSDSPGSNFQSTPSAGSPENQESNPPSQPIPKPLDPSVSNPLGKAEVGPSITPRTDLIQTLNSNTPSVPGQPGSKTLIHPDGNLQSQQDSSKLIVASWGKNLVSLPVVGATEPMITNPSSQLIIAAPTINPGNPQSTAAAKPIDRKIGEKPISFNSASEYIIGGQTLIPGAPAITTSGTIVLAPFAAAIVIDGSTTPLSSPPLLPTLTIGGKQIIPNSASEYIIGGQTLIPGAPAITTSGTTIGLAPSAAAIVIDGSTTPPSSPPLLPTLTIGGTAIVPNRASEYIIGGQTLVPGAPALAVSGTTVGLAPSASAIVIDGTATSLHSPSLFPVLTIEGKPITANTASEYVIGGQTLIPGASAITVSGKFISLAPSASAIVIDGIKIPLSSPPLLPILTIEGNAITAINRGSSEHLLVAGHTITHNAATQYLIQGKTLVPGGPALTISGTRIILAPQATAIGIGLARSTNGSTQGLITGPSGRPNVTTPLVQHFESRAATAAAPVAWTPKGKLLLLLSLRCRVLAICAGILIFSGFGPGLDGTDIIIGIAASG